MTRDLPLRDALAIVAEYRLLCDEYGYAFGVSFRVLLDHDYRQGAQLRELTPDVGDRVHAADQHSFLKGAKA